MWYFIAYIAGILSVFAVAALMYRKQSKANNEQSIKTFQELSDKAGVGFRVKLQAEDVFRYFTPGSEEHGKRPEPPLTLFGHWNTEDDRMLDQYKDRRGSK